MSHGAIRLLAIEAKTKAADPLARDLAELLLRVLDEIKAASEDRSLA
jgi:hypothetical protein